jgi:hypothetical protein
LATLQFRFFEPKLSKVANIAKIASVFPTTPGVGASFSGHFRSFHLIPSCVRVA